MGDHAMTMKLNLAYATLLVMALAVCYPALAAPKEQPPTQPPCPNTIDYRMWPFEPAKSAFNDTFKNAQDYIQYFRQGGGYYDQNDSDRDSIGRSLPGLMIGNRPDPEAMKALGEALATNREDVRKDIVRLLGDVKHLTCTGGEPLIPEVVELLVGPGFAKLDKARETAMEILRRDASPATLSRYGDIFTKELKRKPDARILLLIAKAKVFQAREEVERLSQLPEWREPKCRDRWGCVAIRIARAALGNTAIEDEFIAEAVRIENELIADTARNATIVDEYIAGAARKKIEAAWIEAVRKGTTQKEAAEILRRSPEDNEATSAMLGERWELGKNLKNALNDLSLIGTPKSLRAICPHLRSPLIFDHPYTSRCSRLLRKPVRMTAMKALQYAFPQRRELNWKQVHDRMDYLRAEQVCVEELGFDFTGIPEPEFLKWGCAPPMGWE
jgi:hypothetical protein